MKAQITYLGIKLIGFDLNGGIICNRTMKPTKDAAKHIGIPLTMVRKGYNNLQYFWIVSQPIGDTLRIWNTDGTWLDVPCENIDGINRKDAS